MTEWAVEIDDLVKKFGDFTAVDHVSLQVGKGEIDFESVVKMSDGLNGADLRNVVTESGFFAIKDYRDAVNQDDFNKAVRKVAEAKKLEGKLEYQKL